MARFRYPDDADVVGRRGGLGTEDLPLFAPAPRARSTDPATSHDAAHHAAALSAHQRTEILAALRDAPGTADAIDQRLAYRPTTAGRRLAELERAGLARRTARTARTRSGRAAEIWEAA